MSIDVPAVRQVNIARHRHALAVGDLIVVRPEPTPTPMDAVRAAPVAQAAPAGARVRARAEAVREPLEVVGRRLWTELHGRATAYAGDVEAERAWLAGFARRVPCGVCRESWAAILAEIPPDLADAASYRRWTWGAHNRVRAKLKQPLLGWDEAADLWAWMPPA